MNSLHGPELDEVDDHLMLCEFCQDRLAQEDRTRGLVRVGAKALLRHRARVLWRSPKLAWALGLAAMGMLVFAGSAWQSSHRSIAPAVVVLQATRGTEVQALATAPARQALTVVLDLTGLQQFSTYRLEIVNAGGRPAFQSSAFFHSNTLQVTLARGLAAGAYYVRVYAPGGELLREYALTVRK